MNRTLYVFVFLLILRFIDCSSAFGQASVYSQKRGGFMISIDDTPASDADISLWEQYRVLFNKYNFKFNIALQSEGLNRTVVSAEVKKMMDDGHEMMDHCPQENVSEFKFYILGDDAKYYGGKSGFDFYSAQPGVFSVTKTGDKIGDQVDVILKTSSTLDPSALPVLAERTRLLYRRYLKDSIRYPKVLAQPGGSTSISHADGYKYLKEVGYTAAAYDGQGNGPDEVVSKTYNTPKERYGNFNIKRSDYGKDFTNIKYLIADEIAKHKVFSILFHYVDIPGLLSSTEDLLKWCKEKDIPLLPISQWMTNLFDSTPDPTTNVFPDISKDLDGDGKPDGYLPLEQNVTINKTDLGIPGGTSITKRVWGNLFQISGLGGIEKGGNVITFSAKGQLGATIRIKINFSETGQTYCNSTITLDSPDWKTYKVTIVVPEVAILSDVYFSVENINSSSDFVSMSNWQLSKAVKEPTTKISDATITINQTISLSADLGCTNYRWSTGATSQNIIFDGTKSGPGTFPISYTADDATGALIADKAVITVTGLLYAPNSFILPALSATGILKITANIPWTITTKKNLATVNKTSGISSADVTVSMSDNVTVEPVNDTLIISSSQAPIFIPILQSGIATKLSISKTSINNLPRKGKIENFQVLSNTKWKISSKPAWITISPLNGSGNTSLTFTADSNKLVTERSDSIIIKAPNGQNDSLRVSLTINQMGEDQYLNLDIKTITVKASANTATLYITSNTKWTTSGMPTWITPQKITGTGTGNLLINILPNPLRTERNGTFKVSTSNDTTRIVTVTQAGLDFVDIDRKTIQVLAAAKTETFTITSSTAWNVSNKSSWMTVTPANGSMNNLLTLTIQENKKVDLRKDTITIKAKDCQDQIIEVIQTGVVPNLTLDKSTVTVPAIANIVSLKITANTTWTITDIPSWIKPSQLLGDGNSSITLAIDQNKLKLVRAPGTLTITPTNGAPVLFEVKQDAAVSYITPSAFSKTVGPTNGDTTSIFVLSNVKWKIINAFGWIKTNPDAWLSMDGDKKINITLSTQWLSLEDITGTDLQGGFTIEEDSSLPDKIIKTIAVTLKSIPAVLKVPFDTVRFTGVASKTLAIESNLSWNIEKKTNANWLNISPTYSSSGIVNIKLDCITANEGSRDNSVYLILKQAKGVVKDSVLIIQSGKPTGIKENELTGFKIYPQPALETLNIDLPVNNTLKYWNIYSQGGIELLKGRIENRNKLQISITSLPSGVYFISLRSDANTIGLKFTK